MVERNSLSSTDSKDGDNSILQNKETAISYPSSCCNQQDTFEKTAMARNFRQFTIFNLDISQYLGKVWNVAGKLSWNVARLSNKMLDKYVISFL